MELECLTHLMWPGHYHHQFSRMQYYWPIYFTFLKYLLSSVFLWSVCDINAHLHNFILTLPVLCFPGQLGPEGVTPVKWQVSLMREARLYGGEDLCWGSVLPQGVFPLCHLQLRPAPGSACLRLWTGYVSLNESYHQEYDGIIII